MRLLLAALLCATISDAQDRLHEKVERLYEAGRYERQLPYGKPEPLPPEPAKKVEGDDREREPLIDRNPATPVSRGPRPDPPPGPGRLAAFLFWLPWIAVGVLVAFMIANLISRRRKLAAKPPETRTRVPVPAPAPAAETPASLGLAEALAREGRYAEAIHALLLAAIEAVREVRPVAASLTSREVAASAGALSDGGRQALRQIVQAVEITRFGGRPAGAREYEACVAAIGTIV
jgi:hypothetical protein